MPGFAASKDAGEPCPNLDTCGQCRIYPDRAELGFAGCIGFECFGAGPYVTQTLFAGHDRLGDPGVLRAMCEAFLERRRGFELLYLVDHARATASASDLATLAELERAIEAWVATPQAGVLAGLEARVRAVYAGRRTTAAAG